MPINSQDDLAAALAAGDTAVTMMSKNTHAVGVQAAGVWYDLSKGAGMIPWDAVIGSGTNLTFQPVSDTTTTTAATAATSGSIATTTFIDTTHGRGRFTVGMELTARALRRALTSPRWALAPAQTTAAHTRSTSRRQSRHKRSPAPLQQALSRMVAT